MRRPSYVAQRLLVLVLVVFATAFTACGTHPDTSATSSSVHA
jgi:hypothetical protein